MERVLKIDKKKIASHIITIQYKSKFHQDHL